MPIPFRTRRDTRSVFHRGPSWLLGALLACSCAPRAQQAEAQSLPELRQTAPDAEDADAVANWLLAELLQPGGDAEAAKKARRQLDERGGHSLHSDLARGLDDALHGQHKTAADHFLWAAEGARTADGEDNELLAHFAIVQAMALRSETQHLWKRWGKWVERALRDPGHLGWRARDALVEWSTEEAWSSAKADIEEVAAKELGCLSRVRLAGPFGSGFRADSVRSHAAERVGPWPEQFSTDPISGHTPRRLETSRTGCTVEVDEPVASGVFYAETYLDVPKTLPALLVVQGALKVWVDGEVVLDRDIREWGSWTKVAAGLTIPAGRHRVLARLTGPQTAIRLLTPQGLPLSVKSSDEPGMLVGIEPARVSFEGSSLRAYVTKTGVRDPGSALLRYVAAHTAHHDGEDEVATLLLEPLAKDTKTATGPALELAATLVEQDPIFDANQTQALMSELYQRAIERDPRLWRADLNVTVQIAQSRGLTEAIDPLRALTERYPQVPALLGTLATAYGELGWVYEHEQAVKLRAARFPEDVEGLYAAAQLLTEHGERDEANRLYQKIRRLDPDSEVLVGIALERQDYPAAIAELERLHERRPHRKDILRRIDEVARSSGEQFDVFEMLNDAISRSPRNGNARLARADAEFAHGDKLALRDALVEAIQTGANPAPLKNALDLVEGATELEPYRLDGKVIIADYEAAGQHMEGNAARILDYMAAWVRDDGSSRMLEHEIIRVQSEEAISRFAEHAVRGDLVLQMRVIKQDGRILEPEAVPGKPTVTFPHLEIGDYIETEQIYMQPSRASGAFYDGPHWFFREKGVAYARSEFVLIAPTHKLLDIETTGNVPVPVVGERGSFQVRRWRVDFSPAAPEEPFSVPLTEYLPSVRVGWGLNLDRRLQLLSDQAMPTTPVDPRIVRVARKIVDPLPRTRVQERARRLYRWVLSNVQPGEESDGRRAVIGKQGNPWQAFTTLCRALDIPVRWAVAKNRLAKAPTGPASEARQFDSTVLRVGGKDPVWVTLDNKFAPFGYVPAAIRGMPAHVLHADGTQLVTLPTDGPQDRIGHHVVAKLAKDGSASLEIRQSYEGEFAATLRKGLSEVAERRLHDVIETQLLGGGLPGARLLEYELVDLDQTDAPLVLMMKAEVPHLATVQGSTLRVRPPYALELSRLAALPARQTAILIGSARRQELNLEIELPPGARVDVAEPRRFEFQGFDVTIGDEATGRRLRLQRQMTMPATRIAPEVYPEFIEFTRKADAATSKEIVIQVE